MNDALLGFCGYLEIKNMMINKAATRMQISTKLHTSFRTTASKA